VLPRTPLSAKQSSWLRAGAGFVNAILRRVGDTPIVWPSDGARLSYPDWIVDRLRAELGDEAEPALSRMNEPAPVSIREDGYRQDLASQWVASAVESAPAEQILDLCAAPGGKATAMAAAGASVIAADLQPHRARLITGVPVVVADAVAPPFPSTSFDKVLIDAPCSGLGALRRRADARWRITEPDIAVLATLQRDIIAARRRWCVPVVSWSTACAPRPPNRSTTPFRWVRGHHPAVRRWRPAWLASAAAGS
jgi:16S rRNA (cytosine967-C5)-methyltransferase